MTARICATNEFLSHDRSSDRVMDNESGEAAENKTIVDKLDIELHHRSGAARGESL